MSWKFGSQAFAPSGSGRAAEVSGKLEVEVVVEAVDAKRGKTWRLGELDTMPGLFRSCGRACGFVQSDREESYQKVSVLHTTNWIVYLRVCQLRSTFSIAKIMWLGDDGSETSSMSKHSCCCGIYEKSFEDYFVRTEFELQRLQREIAHFWERYI